MQVQNTNDSSIVSKFSSSKMGYFHDSFLKIFVEKDQRRSPIINRGYYIRFKAIERTFKLWFQLISSQSYKTSQIISLGAGFDTSYFRLNNLNEIPSDCKFVEIDYPEVLQRKSLCIKNSLSNINLKIVPKANNEKYNIVSSCNNYVMIALDLKNCEELEKCLKEVNINFDVPTLFLSECAITYMDVKSSNRLIHWVSQHFANASFIAYEQVHPNDGFGIVMQNHFSVLGCPLKSVPVYCTEERQCSRFKEMGWSNCSSVTMFDFFTSLPDDEKQRLGSLELFDEFEMWHEKCHHYILLWACQGSNILPEMFLKKSNNLKNEANVSLNWKLKEVPKLFERYGHQTVILSSHFLLSSGGFGHIAKQHQRLRSLAILDLHSNECSELSVKDDGNLLGKRMFHTMTALTNGSLVFIGGRSAPDKPFESVLVVYPDCELSNSLVTSWVVERKAVLEVPTWRHSASLAEVDGVENIVLFGGRSVQREASNECYILNTSSWQFSKIRDLDHTPSPRFSHSSATFHKNKVLITGGLSANEEILNSAHIFDANKREWSCFPIAGLLPRYSHTSHALKDLVFLVGGVTSATGFSLGVAVIDLNTCTAREISLPAQDPEYPILLSNHCSVIYGDQIVVTGGGGNCFSFGTHFNQKNIFININDMT